MARHKAADPCVMDPYQLDFRAFHLLTVVHREKSFSRAAEALGVSQSVVSYGIEKLRQVFGDPLFVREGGHTVSTERCEGLARYASDLLAEFDSMQQQPRFDPSEITATLTFACNYYERSFLIPAVVAKLRREAPKLNIEVIDASGSGHRRLIDGEADMLIGPYRRADAGFFEKTLIREQYVCLMDASHPAAGRDPTLEEYLAFDHVLITYGGRWVSPYVSEIEAMGHRLNAPLKVPSPAGIDRIVAGSDLVATVPRRLAQIQDPTLAIVACPINAPLEVKMVWSVRKQHSALMKWARERISATVAELSL